MITAGIIAKPWRVTLPESMIVIVAYAGETAALEQSLAAVTNEDADSILVLASNVPELSACAQQWDAAISPILPAVLNPADYWCTVSLALAGYERDCLVIRAGTWFPPEFERRLCMPDVEMAAALFPLTVRDIATSAFLSTDHEVGLDAASIDHWLNVYAPGLVFDLPGFCGFTAFLRPQLVANGDFADDVALAQATLLAGASLLCTDSAYVDDSHLPPATLGAGTYAAWAEAALTRHPLTGVRHALTELSARGELPPADLPIVSAGCLHISHAWGGGLAQWIDDFASADKGTRHYILKSIGDWDAHGKSLALYEHPDGGDPLGWWTLARPILSTARHHHEYRAILQSIIDDYAIDTIITSTVIGHSLDALRTELPTLVVCHDFYPACPVLYASFGGPCDSCEAPRLDKCLTENPEHRYFRAEPAGNWLQLRLAYAELLRQHNLPVVAPGHAVGQRIALIAPELAQQQITIIPHGLPPSLTASLRKMRPSRPPQAALRVLVPGSLQTHKGLELLRELIRDQHVNVHFYLLGCGDDGFEFEGHDRVTITAHYVREELASHLAEISPDLGLLLSTVPETFSYTLAELQAARIPVVATNIGAFAERVRNGNTGWLVSSNSGEVAQTLSQLEENRGALEQARANLADTTIATTVDTVARYRALLGHAGKTAKRRPPYLRKRNPLVRR